MLTVSHDKHNILSLYIGCVLLDHEYTMNWLVVSSELARIHCLSSTCKSWMGNIEKQQQKQSDNKRKKNVMKEKEM